MLAPEATACPCCRCPLVEIGVDTAERLDVIPAQFRVVVTKRPKLACRACPGVVLQAPAPVRLIEGGAFRWPPVVDGVLRLTAVEFAALFDGIDWRRVQATREIPTPSVPA